MPKESQVKPAGPGGVSHAIDMFDEDVMVGSSELATK